MFSAWALLATGGDGLAGQTILNVERGFVDEPEGLHWAVEAGADIRRGNEELVEVEVAVAAGYRWPGHWVRVLTGGEVVRGEGEDLARSGLLHLRYNRVLLGTRWRTFHFVQAQVNRAILLDRRTLVGSGVRVLAVDRGDFRLDLGAGLMLEAERLDPAGLPPTEEIRTRVARATHLLVARYEIREGVRWMTVTYYQPRPGEPEDFRMLQDHGLTVELSDHLELETRIEWRYDSRPPAGVRRSDVALATGFRFAHP